MVVEPNILWQRRKQISFPKLYVVKHLNQSKQVYIKTQIDPIQQKPFVLSPNLEIDLYIFEIIMWKM